MYQKGDLIIYSEHGVCRVLNVGIPNLTNIKPDTPYYTLSPVYTPGAILTIYIPVNTDVFMRPIISKKEAENLIRRLPEIQEAKCKINNFSMLHQYYDKYLKAHDCEALFQIIKGIYLKGKTSQKLGTTDQQYMKRAENLLYGELAAALEIPLDEVVPYIEKTMAALGK